MKFGLEQHIIDKLIAVFEQHSKVDKALVFGSRAKGNYRPDSDIDIALKGPDLNTDDIIAMSVAFEEKGISHKIDLINYDTIKEPDLKDHIDRVGIELYSRWKEVKLGDVVKINQKTIDKTYKNSLIEYLDTGSIKQNKIEGFQKFNLVDAPSRAKRLVKKNDIIYSTVRPIQRHYGFIEDTIENLVVSTGFAVISTIKEKANAKYLFYLLSSDDIVNYLDSIADGSTSAYPSLRPDDLAVLDVFLPPLSEQTSIASILSSLDDKIDLLHRQNKTLEQLAETLFRQWFVEEAEESWAVEPLGKVFDIGIGRTPPRKEQHWFTLNPIDVKWVSIKDMGTSGIYIDKVSEYLTQEAVEQFSVPVIPENTVMLSFKMTIGRLAISTEKMVSNEAIAHFKQKEGSFLFPEFLYLFLKTYSWVELGSTSSIVESINSQMIKEIEMVIPNKEKLIAFKEMIKPTFNKIKTNQNQIRTLTQTRDNLLPKLMSGEVRVKI